MNGKRVLITGSLKSFTQSAGCVHLRTKACSFVRYTTLTRAQRYAARFPAALLILFAMSATAAAADWYVNDLTGNDAFSCTSATMPCKTIQAAIIKASPNDTIHVAAGLYLEAAPGPLTVNKTLTLLGAQAGVDARNPRGAESMIDDIQGTSVSASNVVIDGFTVQNSTSPAFTGFGIWLNPGVSGTKIINNIIQDNIVGIGLANAGASQALIRHNWIRNNTKPGGAQGSGIYTDEFAGGPTVRNVLVQENTFSGHTGFGGAINISNTDAAGGVFNLDVDTNSFDMNSRAFVLFNTHDSTIHDNKSMNSTFVGSADVRIFDNNTNLSILRNDLMIGAGHAIRLSDLGILGPSSGVEIHFNNIENFALTGLTVDPLPPGHFGTVDAECNWWNSSSGPFNVPNNLTGTGEEVVGDADFTPWLIARYPAPCIGGLPSTPGKVTGGGQIDDSDPLFSPFGELISLPAILVSTNATGAQANFGFVIQFTSGASAPKGNLTYEDHGTGTRIKATSYDSLQIRPGICGPNTHATFTGSAEVNGVSESLIVQVDDCGEPSSGPPPDMFSITTDSYSNSGALIRGNIQIH